MTRPFRVLLIAAAVVYLGLCGSLYFSQRSLIYFPTPRSASGGETITLPIANERVLVSTRALDGPRALIYFGGNAENVSFSLPGLSAAFPDSAIYLLHYRGYGGSSGSPSEEALFSDALALFDQVHPQHRNIEVVGPQLGQRRRRLCCEHAACHATRLSHALRQHARSCGTPVSLRSSKLATSRQV